MPLSCGSHSGPIGPMSYRVGRSMYLRAFGAPASGVRSGHQTLGRYADTPAGAPVCDDRKLRAQPQVTRARLGIRDLRLPARRESIGPLSDSPCRCNWMIIGRPLTRRSRHIFVCCGFAVWLAACGSPLDVPEDATLVGEVVRAGHGLWSGNLDGPFQIHVKSDLAEECGVILSIDSDTAIFDSDRVVSLSSVADVLEVGATVALWFGLVDDSCPQQTHAQVVQRLK